MILPGPLVDVKIQSAEIQCDSCKKKWDYKALNLVWQPRCEWRQTPEHYVAPVAARVPVGSGDEPVPKIHQIDGLDFCDPCLRSFKK